MRKILFLSLALTLSVGLWAIDGVKYIDANGQEQTANNVTEITNSSSDLPGGWYVVTGADVQTRQLTCKGAVHLILADGAKLTAMGDDTDATPGIEVSGGERTLTVYGQAKQSGQLIATGGAVPDEMNSAAGIGGGNESDGSNITINGGIITANGGPGSAGIGGGWKGNGSNITINGGKVTANGGDSGAGIGGGEESSGDNITINGGEVIATGGGLASGIGGGGSGAFSYITINGGTVTANGGEGASGIGGGLHASGSKIFVSTQCIVKAGEDNPPTTVIANNGSDLTDALKEKQFVSIVPNPVIKYREKAINEIRAAVEDNDSDEVKTIANDAVPAINAATTLGEVDATKTFALAAIASVRAAYNAGKADAKAELPTDDEDAKGAVVVITKGEKTLKLVNPDAVEYDKQE